MNETNFNWDDLRLFLAVARAGGLAGAARRTGKSSPTLGRRMLALEHAIGTELFRRLPRGYELTEQGQRVLDDLAGLEARIEPLINAPDRNRPFLVKISAGTWMTQALCARADQLCKPGEQVKLRFIAADHLVDIGHREAVVGIRNRRPEQAGLACRKIGRVRFAVFARDTSVNTWAQVIGSTPSALWLTENTWDAPGIEVTSARNALDLALAGTAKALLPTFVGAAHPSLRAVSPVIAELDHDQWLVSHHEDRFLPEIRRVIDRMYLVLQGLHRADQDTG